MKTLISLLENVPLAPLTTLKVGGKARFYVKAENEQQIIKAFNFAYKNEFDIFILGGGSNVLISDQGFEGLVLHVLSKGITAFQEKDKTFYVTAQAGEDWDEFVKYCVEKNLAGIECLSGIPGFVGGTPIQNVGAYGQEVSETIVKTRVFDRKSKEILELSNADCKFTYRSSIFNSTEKNRFIVLAVTFALKQNGEPKIVYKDLLEFFGDKKPSLSEAREAVLTIRRAKSMVIENSDPNSKSVGSFFKNPVISRETFDGIEKIAAADGIGNVPNFPFDEKNLKIPAAWLIEKAGFQKGFFRNNVGLSTNHTLAIINRGNAQASEILSLKDEIQQQVSKKFGIELQPEPVFVGFNS